MSEFPTGEINVTFPAATSYIHMATTVAKNAASIAGFDNAVTEKVGLCTDEAITNVIKHAYQYNEEKKVTLRAKITEESLTLKIVHTGEALHNEDIQLPNIPDYIKRKRPGGLGLYIMNQFMDEVDFLVGKEHCCQMTKYRNVDKSGG